MFVHRTTTTTAATTKNSTTSNKKTTQGTKTPKNQTKSPSSKPESYINVTGFPFPLGPITRRRTIRRELIKDTIWAFEQPQSLGFSNVTTNIRMTVIKLASGGLWVHAPIAPTPECLCLLRELGAPVEYIILPTFAYEHKIFVGPFSRKFPKAKVYIAPKYVSFSFYQLPSPNPQHNNNYILLYSPTRFFMLKYYRRQWSWPINLPVQFFGIFPSGTLRTEDTSTPWSAEIEQKVLVSSVGIGPYIEVAFFHKKTQTLLVTDAVISVPEKPSELVADKDIIDAAKSNFFVKVLAGDLAEEPVNGVPLQPTEMTPAVRDLGWRRMALQILYIVPGDLRDPTRGFKAIANRLIVGPILKTLVFTTEPELSRDWVESICKDWNFKQIIPAHFTAPIQATPKDLRKAFSFLYDGEVLKSRKNGDGFLSKLFGGDPSSGNNLYPAEDIKALDNAKEFLVKAGVVNK